MLNINKIESDIHSRNLQSTDVSKIIGVKYTTTLGRRESGKWTPNDLEKFADYFGRSIAYYFDREETQAKVYKTESASVDVIEDPEEKYCKGCEELRRFSQMQEDIITTQSGNIEDLREHIETLKSTFGLGKNLKSGLG